MKESLKNPIATLRKKIVNLIATAIIKGALDAMSKNWSTKLSKEDGRLIDLIKSLADEESVRVREDFTQALKFVDDITHASGYNQYRIHLKDADEDVIIRAYISHKKK